MKIDFYHEGISQEVIRFTVFGVQFEKQDRWALHIWVLGFGIQVIF